MLVFSILIDAPSRGFSLSKSTTWPLISPKFWEKVILDIIKNLVLSANGSIRMNYAKGNTTDGLDNDKNGKIDDSGENFSINNSGIYMMLGYRF